jgi:ADP-ribose pyrophosphatase YjhB (NUDIX family)
LNGIVEAILTAPAEALPMRRHYRLSAIPGVGLAGDRYATGNGYWSGNNKVSRDLTLVEAEAIEEIELTTGIKLRFEDLRRNVVVRGIRLNDLVGARFRVGEVLVEATGLCEPCAHLARMIGQPILQPLVHRGGLRVNVLSPGEITLGDRIDLDVPDVGVAVVVRREGRYLLGQRLGSRGRGTWSTPGGSVRSGEGILACALRELVEETGLAGQAPRVIGHSVDAIDGAEWCSVFVAVDLSDRSEPRVMEPRRAAAWDWFDATKLPTPLFEPIRALMQSHGTASP